MYKWLRQRAALSHTTLLVAVICAFWIIIHIPGLQYGAQHVIPLHGTYVGDEQVSVNSALRMLNERSPFAFRDRIMQYYGPMLVVFDTPGVIVDFASKYLSGTVRTAEEYKNYLLWDWSGIIINIRVTAMLSMLLGLVAVYLLLRTPTFNVRHSRYLPIVGVVLVGFNYYYFEFSHFALHWAYVIPLLLWQYYTMVRIIETDGATRRYWVLHGVLVVVSFGVSYFSIIFSSMWLPFLLRWVRGRNRVALWRFGLFAAGTGVGLALMVWWHPLAFFRLLTFMGIGEPMSQMGDAQNPFVVTWSTIYVYLKQIILNHVALVGAAALLVWRLAGQHVLSARIMLAVLLPGMMNFLLFGPAEHYEGRYMLPTIASLLVAFLYLLRTYLNASTARKRLVDVALTTLVVWSVCFHLVHIVLWMHLYGEVGAVEQAGLYKALELQKTGSPILVVNSYLFNYPHTQASYRAFQQKRRLSDSPLYEAMYAHPAPDTIPTLDARYVYEVDVERNPSLLTQYPHVLWLHKPRTTDWTQFTFFDEDLLRNWYHAELSPSFFSYSNASSTLARSSTSTKAAAGSRAAEPRSYGTSTLLGVLTDPSPKECTFTVSDSGSVTSGRVQARGGEGRADIEVKLDRNVTTRMSIMLIDGYIYFWGKRPEGNDQGTRISVEDMLVHEGGPSTPTLPVGLVQMLDTVCTERSEHMSFSVPEDVTFTDFDSSME